MAEYTSPKGMIFKLPYPNTPDFVKGKLSIKRIELIEYLQSFTDEWLNFDLRTNREGKPYIAKDEWKPAPNHDRNNRNGQSRGTTQPDKPENDENSDDLPF